MTNTYTLTDLPELPSRAASGGKKSEFSVLDDAKVGQGIFVSKSRIASCRSYVRGKSVANPTIVFKTRMVTEGPNAGSYMVRREPNVEIPAPTAPEAAPAT